MNLKILIVYEYQILFEILNEIQDILNFKIIKSEKNDYKDIKFDPKINYLTISKKQPCVTVAVSVSPKEF